MIKKLVKFVIIITNNAYIYIVNLKNKYTKSLFLFIIGN